jgi:hypothetical protein
MLLSSSSAMFVSAIPSFRVCRLGGHQPLSFLVRLLDEKKNKI